MNYTIRNSYLTVEISDLGAELRSIRNRNGEELLWQGDPAIWEDRSPVLFPICGRLWNGVGTADGEPLRLDLHGFFRSRPATVLKSGNDFITFSEVSDEQTLACYPYPFRVDLTYTLKRNTLTVRAQITNTGKRTMHYGYGAHPGFRLPPEDNKVEDYFVRFPRKKDVKELNFDPDNCFLVGGTHPFPMTDGDTYVFDDAIFAAGSFFLTEMPHEVTLSSRRRGEILKMKYDGFPYLGFWKEAGAGFLCIEPWDGMPSYYGETTEIATREDFVHLAPGAEKTHEYSVTFLH